MKRIVTLLGLFICFAATLLGQLNPTTHIKPAQDTGRVLISKANNRYVERNLYSYLKDSLNFGLAVVDSTRLTQDSILVYYNAGSEVGRDTIRTAGGGGGGLTLAGASGNLQYNNGSGDLGAESTLTWNAATDILTAGNAVYTAQIYGWTGDLNSYNYWTTDDRIDWAVGGVTPFFSLVESTSDYVTLGTGVGINLSATSLINDSAGSTGSTGQILKRTATGITWQNESGGLTVSGSSGDVQYNNGSGGLGGESTFNYNSTSNLLTIEDLYVTTGLYDGGNSLGTNLELLTSTGTESRWKSVTFDVTDGVFDFNLDGATAASVDLSGANLSDAGKIFNNANAQNFYQISPTKITDWGTTASFTGDNIAWTSATDRWTVTYAGKYRVKCMINLDGTTELIETPIRFEIRVNGSKTGIYYHYFADPNRFVTISIDEVLELSATDYVEIYVQRGDAGTGKTVTFSATSESYFMVERINY